MMDIRILGAHRCESKSGKCISLLIDKELAIDAGGLTSSLSLVAQKKLEAILLTHEHYDHIRDIPMIAINRFLQGGQIQVYGSQEVLDSIIKHLLNGTIYPKFQEIPEEKPAVLFNYLKPCQTPIAINGHHVLALPINHSKGSLGYQITDSKGHKVFYTADCGPGLLLCWQYISPDLLITEVTLPNSQFEYAMQTKHFTPRILSLELKKLQKVKGHLPQVIVVHMDNSLESEIDNEVSAVARELGTSIVLAKEGMRFTI